MVEWLPSRNKALSSCPSPHSRGYQLHHVVKTSALQHPFESFQEGIRDSLVQNHGLCFFIPLSIILLISFWLICYPLSSTYCSVCLCLPLCLSVSLLFLLKHAIFFFPVSLFTFCPQKLKPGPSLQEKIVQSSPSSHLFFFLILGFGVCRKLQ
jgi:hypothetical protein